LLEDVEGAVDDVAALVVLGVEGRWTSAGAATVLAVADLVGRLWDDRGDRSGPQVFAGGP